MVDIMTYNLRTQIITVATDLFMKQGYVATSTRQIASILDVTQPAIYHHFKNKEEIFIEVISQFAVEIGSDLNAILIKKQSKRDCLTEMALYLRDKHKMNFTLMMNDLQHSVSKKTNSSIFSVWSENYFNPFIQYFESIEKFIIPELSTANVSQHFLRVLSSYISESYSNDALDTIKIEDMINIFLRGITDYSFNMLI